MSAGDLQAARRIQIEETFGDATVHATVREDFADGLRSVLRDAAEDTPLADGREVSVGWGPVRLRARSGQLVAVAPDYRAMFPRQDETDDLTDTFWIRSIQAELHGVSGLPVGPITGFNQSVYIVEKAWTSETLCIRREATGSERFSGWFVDPHVPPAEASHRGAARVNKAYSLFTNRPALLAAVNLPPGFVAVSVGPELTSIHDESGTAVFTGPFPDLTLPRLPDDRTDHD